MIQDDNPFASPQSEPLDHVYSSRSEGLSADGRVLWASVNAEFPDRCVKCNAPAGGFRLKRTLSWHPRWVFLLIFIALLLYVVIALVCRKQATYHIGLCEMHREKRRVFQTIWFGIAALGGLAIPLAFYLENLMVGLVGGVGGFLGLLIAMVGSQVISAARITEEHAEIKGCGGEFLLGLQEA